MSILEGADRRILDFEDGMHRFMNKEELLLKFLMKFLDDQSFVHLKEALNRQDCGQAFKEAHTLKGVAANLALTELTEVSSELTELLRAGELTEAVRRFPELEETYEKAIDFLQNIRGVSE